MGAEGKSFIGKLNLNPDVQETEALPDGVLCYDSITGDVLPGVLEECVPVENLINYDAAVNQDEILKDGFFNGFPQLHQFTDNDVLLHYSKAAGHLDYLTSMRVARLSTDGGKTFGEERVINPSITNYAVNNVTTFITKTNRFITINSPLTSTGVNDGFIHIKYSDDKCQTFSAETLIAYPSGMVVCAGYGKGVDIADDKIMLGFYGYTGAGGTGDYRNYVITSSDNGVTWSTPVLVISTDSVTAKYTEATYGYCTGGRIIGIIRNDLNDTKFVQVRSDDNGETWGTTGVVTFGALSSHSPEIAPYYEANGDYYLSLWYVNRNTPRELRSIVAKVDDLLANGVSAWRTDKLASIGTHVFPSGDFGYPSVINPRKKNRFLMVSYLAESVGASEAYLRFFNYTWNVTTATPTDLSNAIVQTVTNGDTTHASSSDALFDALALKSNLSGGNTISGNQIINDVVSIGTTDVLTKVNIYNNFATTAKNYALKVASTRSGAIISVSDATTLATDLAFSTGKFTNPELGTGLTANLFRVYGNGNTVIGGSAGTDAGFKLDVQGTVRATGQVTIPNGTASTSAVNKSQLDAVRPYKVYTALLTQSGTGAPVATVMENTLGLTVTYTYNSVGNYTATAAATFTLNKTYPDIRLGSSTIAGNQVRASRLNTNEITIETFNSSNSATDGVLNGLGLFEIRVYN